MDKKTRWMALALSACVLTIAILGVVLAQTRTSVRTLESFVYGDNALGGRVTKVEDQTLGLLLFRDAYLKGEMPPSLHSAALLASPR